MKKLIIFALLVTAAIYYFGDYYKPNPKMGEIVFDISTLIDKDIDTIIKTFDKTSDFNRDATIWENNFFKKDEDSSLTEDTLQKEGTFKYLKEGWILYCKYNIINRKLIYIYIVTDTENFNGQCFWQYQLQDFFEIANVDSTSNKYLIKYSDSFSNLYDYPDKHNIYCGLKIYRR